MFFFGGFNNIIPHLLYLSLIWAFMIIGLSGKINAVWHFLSPKDYHVEEGISRQPDQGRIYITQSVLNDKQDKTDVNAGACYYNFLFPTCYGLLIFPFNNVSVIQSCLNSVSFRGPPVFQS